MKLVPFVKLNYPELVSAALKLKPAGYLKVSAGGLTYLDIVDEFIHQLYPLLMNQRIEKPDYFGEDLIGAHISVIYPEEEKFVDPDDIDQEHHFKIKGLFTAKLGFKKYYVLRIESLSLLDIRRKYGLPDKLCFKNQWVDFHITIGVQDF